VSEKELQVAKRYSKIKKNIVVQITYIFMTFPITYHSDSHLHHNGFLIFEQRLLGDKIRPEIL
jgi:hypothetical protein